MISSGKPKQDLNHCRFLSIRVITETGVPKKEEAKLVILSKSDSLGVSNKPESYSSFSLSFSFSGIDGGYIEY